jgi:hypothetical protein
MLVHRYVTFSYLNRASDTSFSGATANKCHREHASMYTNGSTMLAHEKTQIRPNYRHFQNS